MSRATRKSRSDHDTTRVACASPHGQGARHHVARPTSPCANPTPYAGPFGLPGPNRKRSRTGLDAAATSGGADADALVEGAGLAAATAPGVGRGSCGAIDGRASPHAGLVAT